MTPTELRGVPARPPGLIRLRLTLAALALFAVAGGVVEIPGWGRLLLVATAVAIPGAVAVQHGRATVRPLLGLPAAKVYPVPTTVRSRHAQHRS
ncbi:hypothetical protein ACIBO1_07460 [Micromonospora sp. NPDC049903]|uniref:hypothetical protein n=1 Tax=Micromonospora sp. NPDC049903 TaxID=3364276 RepID=UPI0037AB5B00